MCEGGTSILQGLRMRRDGEFQTLAQDDSTYEVEPVRLVDEMSGSIWVGGPAAAAPVAGEYCCHWFHQFEDNGRGYGIQNRQSRVQVSQRRLN